MKTAQIHNYPAIMGMEYCQTEGDVAAAVLDMGLNYDDPFWRAADGMSIALKTVRLSRQNLPLVVRPLALYRVGYDDLAERATAEHIEDFRDSEPALIPHGQFIIGDAMTMKPGSQGLNFYLLGSQIAYSEGTPTDRTYQHFREHSVCALNKENLPLKVGMVANSDLLDVQPVEFKPAGAA